MPCPNCDKPFRGETGLAFHLTWCKPRGKASPVTTPEPEPDELTSPWNDERAAHDAEPEPTTYRCAECDGQEWPLPVQSHAVYHVLPVRLTEGEVRTIAAETEPVVYRCAECNRVESAAVVQPAPRKATGPKLPKVSTGKHARCVVHEPMPRAEGVAGVAYACFDVAPDAEAIAERRAFVDAIDASILAHHAAEMVRPSADGLIAGPDGARMTGIEWYEYAVTFNAERKYGSSVNLFASMPGAAMSRYLIDKRATHDAGRIAA